MEEKNRKKLSKWLVRVIIFIVSAVLLWFGFKLTEPLLVKLILKLFKVTTELTRFQEIISYIFGIFDMIISMVISAIVQNKIEKKQNLPQIVIVPYQVQQGQNVSGIKKENPNHYKPKIMLGKKQAKYRIIFAKIVNTGKSSIVECLIEEQSISLLLASNGEIPLYLILYGRDDEKFLNYELKYSI